METKNIEQAVVSNSRIATAAESLNRWFENEYKTLSRACKIGQESLLTDTDPESRAETINSIKQLQKEKRELLEGFKNSSLRRKMKEKASTTHQPEERSCLQAKTDMLRAEGTNTTRLVAKSIFGYAAVFNKLSEDLGGFYEKIKPLAFSDAIRTSDVRTLFNHSADYIYGRTSAATLELGEDSVGLKFINYLLPFDPSSYALARRIDRRDITGCSFSFTVAKDRWELARKPGDTDIRIIEKIEKLYDVCPCTFPAYPATSVSATFEKVQSASQRSTPQHKRYEDLTDEDVEAYFADSDAQIWEEFDREWEEKHKPISDEQQKKLINRLNLLQKRINRNLALSR
jgi:HK97 family phage prohead protease